MTDQIPAYAVAYLRNIPFGDDIIRYLREIDDTLEPFGGEYLVHGGRIDAREGEWDGDLVILRSRTQIQPPPGTSPPTTSGSFRCD